MIHYYNDVEKNTNLLFKNGGIFARIRYLNYCKTKLKKFLDFYLFKNWGPPYYKLKKSFKELPKEEKKKVEEVKIEDPVKV